MNKGTKHFGPFEVNFAASELRKNGSSIRIQEQPLRILEALVEKRGEVVTRGELRQRLWSSDTYVDFERNLNAAMAKLRQTLHDSAERPVYIETLARKGYRFIAPVTSDEGIAAAPQIAGTDPSSRKSWRMFAALVVGTITIAGLAATRLHPPTKREESSAHSIRFSLALPKDLQIYQPKYGPQVAVSRQGRRLVIVALHNHTQMLWWRALDSENWHAVAGSEGAVMPFWSDDEKEVGFYSRGKVWRAVMPSGPVSAVCSAPFFFGADWSRGTIVYSSGPRVDAGAEIYRVPAAGGEPKKLTQLDRTHGELEQVFPQFLSDGRRFLYFSDNQDAGKRGVMAGSLDGGAPFLILSSQTQSIFAAPDQLLFVRDSSLFSQTLDPQRMEVRGKPVLIASANGLELPRGQISVSASANGVVVYRTTQTAASQFVEIDRAGRRVKTYGEPGRYFQVALSRDEKLAALNVRNGPGESDGTHILLLNLSNNVTSEPNLGNGNISDPVWSPDRRKLAFASYDVEGKKTGIFIFSLDDAGSKRLLLVDGASNKPDTWSPDGRFLLCRRDNQLAFTVPFEEGARPKETGDRAFPKDQLTLSPDGKLVAYNTWAFGNVDGPGQQVYIANFPDFHRAVQVSVPNGVQPIWATNGRELLYLTMEGTLMSAKVNRKTRAGSQDITLESPVTLMHLPISVVQWGNQYAVSADGQRIYFLEPVDQPDDGIHIMTEAWRANLGAEDANEKLHPRGQ